MTSVLWGRTAATRFLRRLPRSSDVRDTKAVPHHPRALQNRSTRAAPLTRAAPAPRTQVALLLTQATPRTRVALLTQATPRTRVALLTPDPPVPLLIVHQAPLLGLLLGLHRLLLQARLTRAQARAPPRPAASSAAEPTPRCGGSPLVQLSMSRQPHSRVPVNSQSCCRRCFFSFCISSRLGFADCLCGIYTGSTKQPQHLDQNTTCSTICF